MSFVFGKQVREQYRVSDKTLKQWVDDGRVGCVRSPGGKRMYSLNDIHSLFGRNHPSSERQKAKVCYARVSSAHQAQDLARQVEDPKKAFPENEIVQEDVGSGLNWKRPGFKALLERVLGDHVAEIVVAHRDRLCRFAFELLEQIFRFHQVKLVVLDTYASPESELSDDLLAITTVFVARHNGQRSAANRKKRKRAEVEARKANDWSGEETSEEEEA
jgi:predicted site-specific integrase-resolvase